MRSQQRWARYGHVWGRPVGVTLASDRSLPVSDDESNAIRRVAYTGK
jgi:glucose/arabinose dehydrogenase